MLITEHEDGCGPVRGPQHRTQLLPLLRPRAHTFLGQATSTHLVWFLKAPSVASEFLSTPIT